MAVALSRARAPLRCSERELCRAPPRAKRSVPSARRQTPPTLRGRRHTLRGVDGRARPPPSSPRHKDTRPTLRRARSRGALSPWRLSSHSSRGSLQLKPFQLQTQLLERRVEAALNCAQRNLKRVGNLLKRQLLELLHQNNLAQLPRERGHGAPDGYGALFRLRRVGGRGIRSGRKELFTTRFDLVLPPRLGAGTRAAPARDALVERDAG